MNVIKIGSADASSESEIGGSLHELVRTNVTLRQGESGDDEISVSSLDTLLRHLSENSTREIENLIGELQRLRKKLQTDGNRVQRDIAEYTSLNHQVMQLTKIISESVKKLPSTPAIGA